MLAMVTFVATWIAIFSVGYMHGDPGYPRFFAVISLFVFSMCGLVLANNFLLLVAFWEGVGLCSYLLVGFYFEKPSAAAAAAKAFLVTRLGDIGFVLGIFLLWQIGGWHTDLDDALRPHREAPAGPRRRSRSACLLLFCGAVGKSAQFPLHVWLPDAMEGPTPVSRADPRRDDGDGRRLPGRPLHAAVRAVARTAQLVVAVHRRRHRAAGGADRPDADRPQARAGLLDGQPARLHVPGAGQRRRRDQPRRSR